MTTPAERPTESVRRASDQAQPFNAGAPRATDHVHEGAEQSLHKRVQIRVNELGGVAYADHELEPGDGRSDREIAEVEEGFDFGWLRRRGELSGSPIGDQREGGALRKGSAPRNEPTQRQSREARWSLPNIFLAQELELELLVTEGVTSNAFLDALRGFPREAMHL